MFPISVTRITPTDDDGVVEQGLVLLDEVRVGVLGVDDVGAGGDGPQDAVEDGGPGGPAR